MISVVIPLYNKQNSVADTLRSVLRQSYPDFEIVVVDDGSTDRSAAVVAEIARSDDRIRIIQKKNGGVSSARNAGISESKSEFIAFLDADDIWEPEYLAAQHQLITDFPQAALWGTAFGHIADGQRYSNNFKLDEGYREIVTDYWSRKLYLYWTSAVVARKSALEAVGLFDERINYGEDIDVWYRLILNYQAVFYNRTLAYYCFDAENRAMNKPIPKDKYLPFYIGKYAAYRSSNGEFRKYFDTECLNRIFPYYLHDKSDKDVLGVLQEINLSEFKLSMRWRFIFPGLYALYRSLKK